MGLIELLLVFSQIASADVIEENVLVRYTGEPVYWISRIAEPYPDGTYAEAQVYNALNNMIVATGAVAYDGESPYASFELVIPEVGMYAARVRNCLPAEPEDTCSAWFESVDDDQNSYVYAVLAPTGPPVLEAILAGILGTLMFTKASAYRKRKKKHGL